MHPYLFIGPDTNVNWIKNVRSKLEKNMNICFGGSEESSHCDVSFEHSHLILLSESPDICFGC